MRVIVRRIVHSGVAWLGALILANIAYVGWGWSLSGSDTPATRPQLSRIGPSLRLLDELPPEQLKPVAERPGAQPARAKALRRLEGPVQMECQVWGPFNTRAEVEALEKDIAAAGGSTRVTESRVPGRSDYLVYIGAPGEAENARRVLEELKSQEIDSALITRGRFNNTLSVGVFSRRDRAQRQLERVAKLGYDADIKEIDRSYDVFHLEANVFGDFEAPVAPSGPCNEIAQAH